MIVRIFVIWIALQLMLCGAASVGIHNDIIDRTHSCVASRVSWVIGVIVPLVAFLPEPLEVGNYCATRL